jgi:hypothetical protein
MLVGGAYYAGTTSIFKSDESVIDLGESEFTYNEVVAIVKRDVADTGYLGEDKILLSSDYFAGYMGQGKWEGGCQIRYNRITLEKYAWWEGRLVSPKGEVIDEGKLVWRTREVTKTIAESCQWNFFEKSQTVEIMRSGNPKIVSTSSRNLD